MGRGDALRHYKGTQAFGCCGGPTGHEGPRHRTGAGSVSSVSKTAVHPVFVLFSLATDNYVVGRSVWTSVPGD